MKLIEKYLPLFLGWVLIAFLIALTVIAAGWIAGVLMWAVPLYRTLFK